MYWFYIYKKMYIMYVWISVYIYINICRISQGSYPKPKMSVRGAKARAKNGGQSETSFLNLLKWDMMSTYDHIILQLQASFSSSCAGIYIIYIYTMNERERRIMCVYVGSYIYMYVYNNITIFFKWIFYY